MIIFLKATACLALLMSVFLSLGCNKRAAAPEPPSLEQALPAMESAFQSADAQLKQQAREAAAALKSQDDVNAFVRLQSLSEHPDLTAPQRDAAFKSWLLVNVRLQSAASNGNTAAQGLIERYRATK